MAWAGKQALLSHYGDGHYATVSSHVARWNVISEQRTAAAQAAGKLDDEIVPITVTQAFKQTIR